MSSPETPNLDDVLDTIETPHPDHHEHSKIGHRVDDDELARRTQLERDEVQRES